MRRLVPVPVLLLALVGAGCDATSGGSGPDPQDTADALARALAGGAFADVSFVGSSAQDVTADYEQVVEGMGDVEPEVVAGDVTTSDGGSATAPLTWTWPLGGHEWTYTTDAELAEPDGGSDGGSDGDTDGGTWQVRWSRELVEPSLEADTVLDATTVSGARGDIIGAHGVHLVTSRPVVRVGIDRSRVPAARAPESAAALARLLGVDVAPYVKQVRAAGDQAFVEGIVYRRDDMPLDVVRGYPRIKGAIAVPDQLPLAPTREFAAPILGSVGDVTAEMIEKDPDLQVGDQAGLSGLQARYDDQLQGTDGVVVDAVSGDGRERELFRVRPQPGTPLRLTLDLGRQLLAERLLAGVGPASALVAVRPSDGAVLAAANGPGNDGYNIATYGQLAPGSTFKSVSSLALLRAGLTPSTVVPCAPSVVVDGKRFENYDDYPSSALGQVPFRTAVANSCNTAFISQAPKLHDGDLADAAASLGLGIDHDLGFPAYFGSVQPPASDTEAAADMIGQGTVLASPMAMATVMASIEAGHTVVPRMVDSVDVSVPDDAPRLTRAEDTALRSMLRAVVTSGSGAGLLDVPGPPVIAKTGTAEFERGGRLLTHAWMVAAQGDLAVAVFVDVGASGSGTAGPVLEAFLRGAR